MSLTHLLQKAVSDTLKTRWHAEFEAATILINETKPEFEGDYTVVLFSLVKPLRKAPEQLGQELGTALQEDYPALIASFNVIKGFLNLQVTEQFWMKFVQDSHQDPSYGQGSTKGQKVMIEYSSPNTNKPLHLGHLRNNFLGWSVAEIYRKNGYEVAKTCIANDRGIHICKSMIAWQLFGNGATPESTGIKGDHLVGDYYVMFGNELKKEVEELVSKGMTKEEAEKQAKYEEDKARIIAQQMLVDWEAGKPEVIELWKKMNSWVYQGFEVTYQKIGSDFDKTYYESDTYLLGKEMVEKGLEKDVFFQKEDGSVWIDLTADGLDQKIVRRKDGTAVYITQDLGLAELKQKEFGNDLSVYVVGDEQNYHFKVLKLICQKLGLPSADGIYHLSYGMVELPTGRMKTREGTVVDADDIVAEMEAVAARHTEELGKVKDFSQDELKSLYHTIGLGALKFFLLRVDPKKRMIFNPEESIDFHGFTGPFIQYTHARAKSILRKESPKHLFYPQGLEKAEKNLIRELEKYPLVIEEAGKEMNPSVIAIYAFRLSQFFNSFVTECRVLTAETEQKKELRLQLCEFTANTIRDAMRLLGIVVPERM